MSSVHGNRRSARRLVLFIGIVAMIFAGNTAYWFAYYPGGFNLDAYGQWCQIQGDMQFNNWHPFFVTAIYWMLTRIINSLAFCIGFQLFLFSLSAAALLVKTSEKCGSVLWGIVLGLINAFNPAVVMNNICLIKDVYFTIVMIWAEIFLVILLETKDSSLSIKNCILLAVIALLLLLIRHNGILFVVPLMLSVAMINKQNIRRVMIISAIVIGLTAAIEGPVFDALNVRKHDNPIGEVVGIPMAQMANAMLEDPEDVPPGVREFLLKIADKEIWEKEYVTGEWDSVKWKLDVTELFQDTDLLTIIMLSCDTFVHCPKASILSFACNTRLIWQVFGMVDWESLVYIEKNPYGIVEAGNSTCKRFVSVILEWSRSFVGATMVWNLGGYLLVMIWMMYLLYAKRSYTILLFVPILVYTLCTAFMLSSPNYRYFYYMPVIVPTLALLVLKAKTENGETD